MKTLIYVISTFLTDLHTTCQMPKNIAKILNCGTQGRINNVDNPQKLHDTSIHLEHKKHIG
jgi:hypothetical protein